MKSHQIVFVNYDNPSQIKDRDKRQVVSSHIGRHFRNRSKPAQQALAEQLQAAGSDTEESNNAITEPQLIEIDEVERDLTRLKATESIPYDQKLLSSSLKGGYLKWRTGGDTTRYRSPKQIIYQAPPGEVVQEESYSSSSTPSKPWGHGPLDALSHGRTDPFAGFAVADELGIVQEVIHHAQEYFWPMLSPHNYPGVFFPAGRVYLEQMKSSPLAYYGYMIAISTSLSYLHDSHPDLKCHERLRVRYKFEVMQHVRKTINDMFGIPPDELIGAVLVLGTNPLVKVPGRTSLQHSRFRSPLAQAQLLHMYGTFTWLQIHWSALVQLVDIRGGIQKLSSLEVAGCIQLGDLIHASKNDYMPQFRYYDFFSPFGPSQQQSEDDCLLLDHELPLLATALQDLLVDDFREAGIEAAFRASVETTHALEHYCMFEPAPIAFSKLISLRNKAQHLAISAPKRPLDIEELDRKSQEQWRVYDMIRLALLIYNNLVIFPLPPAGGADSRLAQALKERIVEINGSGKGRVPNLSQSYPKLMLWVLMLGGISDRADVERSWYRDQFSRIAIDGPQEVISYNDVMACMRCFLWSELVLNEEALRFWVECEARIKEDGRHGLGARIRNRSRGEAETG